MKFEVSLRPVVSLEVVAVAIYDAHADVVLQLKDAAGLQLWTGSAKVGDVSSMGFMLNERPPLGYGDILTPSEVVAPGAFAAIRRCVARPVHMAALSGVLVRLGIIPKATP